MIGTIQDAIIAALEDIEGVPTVGAWQGDVDELIAQPQKLPALHVIYQGAEFGEARLVGARRADHTMEFLVVLVARNLKSREAGAAACNDLIEAVRTALIGKAIAPYGFLWPAKEDLILAEGGLLAYGLEYRIQTYVTV